MRPPFNPDEQPDLDRGLGRAWLDHRRSVLDIAFRMLGSISGAEDVVQEAFTRLLDVDLDEIDDVRGWLVVVVSRLCLDQLRSSRWRRQSLTGAVPEHPGVARTDQVTGADPADRITLDDEVHMALHVVLARLTPAERTAFVLHHVFKFSFDEVGQIVGRSPAACRQLAARARRRIDTDIGPARFTVESAEQRRVTERFIAACSTGDVQSLMAVLDPEVAGQADLGGKIGLLTPVVGAEAVAHGAIRFLGPETSTTLLSLPAGDDARVVALRPRGVYAVVTLTVHGGVVDHIHVVTDPAKLADLAASLDA
ncbi:MAG: sigma-70 family RNA polymerase sigma factor [Acidimicrobiales bacterium]